MQINIEVSELGLDGEQHIRKGKFNLVDLAGSERAAKTKASGMRLAEGDPPLCVCVGGNRVRASEEWE